MIRLIRPAAPVELTPQYQKDETAEFKRSGKVVWGREFIRSALRAMSGSKCSFCECQLEEESKYLEVEHFAPKDLYPDLVLEWSNLLPACRRCNGRKLKHDTVAKPIVNPVEEDPRAHLRFRLYRFEGLNAKGVDSVDVIDLNDFDRLTLVRFRIGDEALQQLDEVAYKIETFQDEKSNVRLRNRILRQLRNLLSEAQRGSEYSATVATVIAHAPQYGVVQRKLESLSLWSQEFVTLDAGLRDIAYSSAV